MSRYKIITKLKEKNPKINKKTLSDIFDNFFKSISNSLIQKKSVEIRSLGSFFIKQISEKRHARNPKTGEVLYIPKKYKARFRASKRLKELINK